MPVYVPPELEATEEVAAEPTATVDEFVIEEGRPKGFPSKHGRDKDKEVKDNGPKQGVPGPAVGPTEGLRPRPRR